jgi:rhodanese-related sulfurtransferase
VARSISPAELNSIRIEGQDIDLIDVRTPAEFHQAHVECARNIPLNLLDPGEFREQAASRPIYFVCQKGGRGNQACEKLAAVGITNAVNVEGGTEACEAAGLSMVRGKKTISLERQVRIAAGSLVLLGSVLAWLAHPAFIGFTALIGAGLLFAGITDTCGLGMLLARMPWNQASPNVSSFPTTEPRTPCRPEARP